MGFGFLLVGYVFAFLTTVGLGPYLFAGMLIGGFLMFLGISELRRYCPTFLYALIANILLILCSFYETLAWAESQFVLTNVLCSTGIMAVFDWIELFINLVFNISILYGIFDLSRRVDYPDTKSKAIRNMFFVGVFNIFQFVMMMPGTVFDSDKSFFMTLLMILQVFYTFLNTVLIFKCYAMICPAGQEDMKPKRSKIEFINKMRDIQDKREEEMMESTKAYIENKLKKKNQNQDNNKKSKSKKKK